MLQKVSLFIIICITACVLGSCKSFIQETEKVSPYEKVHKQLTEMESYSAEIEIENISNKGSSAYTARQFCKKTGEYRIETLSPDMLSGSVSTFDGTQFNHYNPRINGKISVPESGASDNALTLLTTFVTNYENSNEVSMYAGSFGDSEVTVLEAKIPGDHPYLSSEKLWVNNKTLLPIKLVIYDLDNSERVVVTYKKFEYNSKLDDKVFK